MSEHRPKLSVSRLDKPVQLVVNQHWSEVMATCEVCRRLDGNLAPKRVKHCSDCGAWICERCFNSYIRRARAVLGGWYRRLTA